jgi:acyl-CoA synthetase (AMP-forming)/AMP-acid ligase II
MKPLTNVGSHLSKRAELNPGVEALVDDATGRRFMFGELDARADRTAHLLVGLGLKKGDRVAVLLPNGHPFVETFYGAARAGLVVVVPAFAECGGCPRQRRLRKRHANL